MRTTAEGVSRDLLDRLNTEETRPTATAGTHLVGGLVKAGVKLEGLLRVIVEAVAEADGLDPSALIAPAGGRALNLRKAMAGPLAYGLRDHLAARRGRPLPGALRPILDDLTARDSRILAFIALRNEVAKEGREPRDARLAMRRLRELITTFRRNAGWS